MVEIMGELYNRKKDNEKRKKLRHEMSKAEVLLWCELKGKQFSGYKFRRQYGVGGFVIDFYCPELRLAIEVDGATHSTDEEIEYDKKRENIISDYNIYFFRFINEEIYSDLHNVKEKIRLVIKNLEMIK